MRASTIVTILSLAASVAPSVALPLPAIKYASLLLHPRCPSFTLLCRSRGGALKKPTTPEPKPPTPEPPSSTSGPGRHISFADHPPSSPGAGPSNFKHTSDDYSLSQTLHSPQGSNFPFFSSPLGSSSSLSSPKPAGDPPQKPGDTSPKPGDNTPGHIDTASQPGGTPLPSGGTPPPSGGTPPPSGGTPPPSGGTPPPSDGTPSDKPKPLDPVPKAALQEMFKSATNSAIATGIIASSNAVEVK